MFKNFFKNPINSIILFYFIFSLSVLYNFNLNISPDGREFLECSKNIFNNNCNYQYLTTFIIFKILNVINFELNFQIFNLIVFFFIFISCKQILEHFDFKIDNKVKLFYLLFLFIFNYDFFQWVNYALSDLILILNILFSINLYLNSKYKILILIILFSFLIKRQSIIMLMILLLLFFEKKNFNNSFFVSLFNLFKVYFPILFVLILFFLFEKFNINIPKLFSNISGAIKFVFFKTIEDGVIVMNRVYLENMPNNFINVIKIYFTRFAYSLSFYFDDYSLKHKFYNILYFTFLLLPFLFLPFVKILSRSSKKILNLNFSIIILILIFIMITFLDYDMRYRIYIFPFIIMNNYIMMDIILKKIKFIK